MRIAAFTIVGSLISVSAHAQVATQFLPIPEDPPAYLFDPSPLAGTMLKPFAERTPGREQEVEPVPGPDPVIVAQTLPQTVASVAPETAPPAPEAAPAAPAVPTEAAKPETPAPTTGTVTVIVENVESAQGTVNVAVCDKSLSRDGCPYTHEVPAAPGFVETEFDNIPPGNYAVVGYHDVNGNNEFDKLFGMPREPYALSSKAADKLVPTFNDAALPINAGPNAVIIRLRRLGG
jgi:uncharacterized protein (DUF2141 family)